MKSVYNKIGLLECSGSAPGAGSRYVASHRG